VPDFRCRRKFSDSCALLMDILELLDGRRRAGHDPEVDEAYARALLELGRVAADQDRFDEALVYFQRTESVLESLVHDPRRLEAIVMIDLARRKIAELLGRRGLEEQRRMLLERHIRMLEHLSDSGGADPAIGLLAALTRADLAADDSAIAPLHAAIQRFPANQRLPEPFETRLGDWIVRDFNPYPVGLNPTGEPRGRFDPYARADSIIRALESRCEALGADHSLLPAVALRVANIAASRGSAQRQAGRLDDARQIAACLSAFANRLERRDPKEAAFHLLRSDAFVQESKNAWQVKDFAAIDEALRKALGEARIALSLDPRNTNTRIRVAGIQDKLIALPSGSKKKGQH